MVELEAKVVGIADYRAALRAIPDKLRKRLLRNALAAGARVVRDEGKARAPVLRSPAKYRKAGTVRDAIKVRTSKVARRAGDVGVFVNVVPAKGAQRGARSPNDPYYWRWLEFGRTGRAGQGARAASKGVGRLIRAVRARRALRAVGPMPAYGFLRAAAQKLEEALRVIERILGKGLQKLNDNPKDEL